MEAKEIENGIGENKIVLLITSENTHYQELEKVVRVLTKRFSNICYISLNKPHGVIARAFKSGGIDIKKMFFIDAVSKTPEENVKALFIPSPKSLIELDSGIDQIIMGSEADCFIFDSLSTLLLYGDSLSLTKFFHSLTLKLRSMKVAAFFAALEKHMSTNLISDISMFVDNTIRLE